MTSLMNGYRLLFCLCHHLGFLFQTTNDTIHGIQKVLLANRFTIETGCYQGGLIADIGDIST